MNDFEHHLRILVNQIVDERINERLAERMRDSVPKCTILSVRAAMERYEVTRSTIYNWMGDGTIRRHEVGGRVYVFVEDFERQKTREEILLTRRR